MDGLVRFAGDVAPAVDDVALGRVWHHGVVRWALWVHMLNGERPTWYRLAGRAWLDWKQAQSHTIGNYGHAKLSLHTRRGSKGNFKMYPLKLQLACQ